MPTLRLRTVLDPVSIGWSNLPWPVIAVAALILTWGVQSHASSMYSETLRVFLDERLGENGAEIEVDVGEPDPRLALAPCAHVEPFIPPGARLSGRTSLGVRCTDGANWTIYLPVQIRLYVDVLVAARPIARGHPMTRDDVRAERVDIAPLRGNAMLPTETLDGRTATRALAMGEPLRRDYLRAPPVLAPGDSVQVVALGTGFAAQSTGRALTAATEGQTAQVAMPGGRVVTGIARAPGTVEVR
jgi:flagellar basal body P-ring formation protein FlgA